jgi:BirA family transcriptional regulator, biotin operon repressor / biotin---[acetyl-CoA-carboxylase] ligase
MLPRSSAAVDNLVVLASAGSTNDEAVARAATSPDFTVIVTDVQTAGRGRLGRTWVAPAGKTLAISVLLRPRLPGGESLDFDHYGWLPLIAGVAMTQAVGTVLPPHRVGLKWPNDVLVGTDGAEAKVCGILAELVPAEGAVVIGAGINLTIERAELPTPTSTSLALAGAEDTELADRVLSAYLVALRSLTAEFIRLGGDAEGSGIRSLVTEFCTTLGRNVRVELPGGGELFGVATGIDRSGRLQVTARSDGRLTAVAAGDVTHLRYE